MGIRIDSISNQGSYGAYRQKITRETREELEKNNIPYNKNITEEEAQKLLESNETQKTQEDSSNNSLLYKAIDLAEKVGIIVDEKEDLESILDKIEDELEKRLQLSENDISALKELKDLGEQLADLQSQTSGSMSYDANNQALMTSLELIAQYNKNFLPMQNN